MASSWFTCSPERAATVVRGRSGTTHSRISWRHARPIARRANARGTAGTHDTPVLCAGPSDLGTMRSRTTLLLALWCAAAFATACDSPGPTRVCTPGASVACVCTDGTTGAQACAPDGLSLHACQCTSPDAGLRDAGPRAEPDAAAPPDAGGPPPACGARALAFSLREPDLPPAVGAVAAGFDLDGLSSTGEGPDCVGFTPDYTSPTGETGVDNGLATLVPTLEMLGGEAPLSAALRRGQDGGEWDLAVVIDRLDTLTNDDDVVVALYRLDAGGAAYEAIATTTAAVAGGVLRASFPGAVPPWVGETSQVFAAPTTRTTLSARISCTGLSQVTLGGAIAVEDIAIRADAIMPGLGDTVRGVFGGVADLDPRVVDSTTCDSISLAYTFGATIPLVLGP